MTMRHSEWKLKRQKQRFNDLGQEVQHLRWELDKVDYHLGLSSDVDDDTFSR